MARAACKYLPSEVEWLASEGRVVATKDARNGLSNHDYDEETLCEVVSSIVTHGKFHKQLLLREGKTADVYNVNVLGREWYLKFHVDEANDGGNVVIVMSCKCW